MTQRIIWEELVGRFMMLEIDESVAWEYGRTYRYLQANGMLIGTNDLWIAAAGLAYSMAVVTRNRREFERVPGLEVLSYS